MPAPGDPRGDAASAQGTAQGRGVVGLVGVQLGRALAGPARFAPRADDRRDRVDQGEQLGRIVGVGGREADGQRDAVAVHDQVVLGAGLAAVGRVRAGLLAPLLARTLRLSSARPAPVDGGLVAQPVQEPFVQLLPDAGRLPVAQPAPAGRAAAAAQLLGQQPPRAAGPEDEDDAGEGGAVRDAGAAALGLRRLLGQERFDGLPEVVGDEGFVLHGPDDAMPAGY